MPPAIHVVTLAVTDLGRSLASIATASVYRRKASSERNLPVMRTNTTRGSELRPQGVLVAQRGDQRFSFVAEAEPRRSLPLLTSPGEWRSLP
jgi:hypothetical protein